MSRRQFPHRFDYGTRGREGSRGDRAYSVNVVIGWWCIAGGAVTHSLAATFTPSEPRGADQSHSFWRLSIAKLRQVRVPALALATSVASSCSWVSSVNLMPASGK
jgi:hypothetical protein